ncbi:hypothetical protein FRC01_005246 [Tulasnella sp. 417]|nr:hypothetical protein FRC01_005246 [Tulasnella sp. 417]
MQSSKDWTRDQDDRKQAHGAPRFPMELWVVVAEQLRHDTNQTFQFYPVRPVHMPSIKSLRLTSRNLNAAVEALFWEQLELDPVYLEKDTMGIIQHLHQNAAHREFVKCLRLSMWRPSPYNHPPPDGISYHTTPPVETLSGIFTKLHNLRAIRVYWSHMTCAMYEHLYSLQQLEYVEFAEPPITLLENSLDSDRLDTTMLRLKAITVSYGAMEGSPPGVPACARLCLSPSLEKLANLPSMEPFIYALTNQQSFDQLRHYEAVEPREWEGFTAFYAFAAHCPNLTSVKFRSDHVGIIEPDRIPAPPTNILTQLRRFEGSVSVAARIVPGRPVENVSTAFPSSHNGIPFEGSLKRLSESSRTLKVLNLTIRHLEDDYLSIISRIVPSVEELEILFWSIMARGEKVETRLHLEQLKPLSRLRAFVLKNLQPISAWLQPPFSELAEGADQIPAMKILCKEHEHLEYVELGQTIRWIKEHDSWVRRSASGSAVVDFEVARSE